MAKRERLRFIEDGYNEDGYIRHREGMWDNDLRFLYRPMTIVEQRELVRRVAKCKEDDVAGQLIEQAKAVTKHIREWDYKRPDGREIEIAPASLLKMKPLLFATICSIVCGYEPSDIDNESPHMRYGGEDHELRAILEGEPNKEDRDAKNSEAG